jgi:hypothetical protein
MNLNGVLPTRVSDLWCLRILVNPLEETIRRNDGLQPVDPERNSKQVGMAKFKQNMGRQLIIIDLIP